MILELSIVVFGAFAVYWLAPKHDLLDRLFVCVGVLIAVLLLVWGGVLR